MRLLKQSGLYLAFFISCFFVSCIAEDGNDIRATYLELSETRVQIEPSATYLQINVKTDGEWGINFTEKDWYELTQVSPCGNGYVRINFMQNTTGATRADTLRIHSDRFEKYLVIEQGI